MSQLNSPRRDYIERKMSDVGNPSKIEALFERALRGNAFSGINRPAGTETSALREEKRLSALFVGTPNGWKIGILLERWE